MEQREILYTTAVKELQILLHYCPDKELVHSFLTFPYAIPIAKGDDVEVITVEELFQLQQYRRDFHLILQCLDFLVDRNKAHPWPYILRGRALWAIQYYVAARQDLEKASSFEKAFITQRLLAETDYFLKRYPQALNEVNLLLDTHPENGRLYVTRHLIYCALAELYHSKDQRNTYLSSAIQDLKTASFLAPRMLPHLQLLIEDLKKRLQTT